MYDVVAGRKVLLPSYILSKTRALELFPMLKKEELKGAIVYYDGGCFLVRIVGEITHFQSG